MVTTLRTTPVRPAPGAVAEHLAPLLELVFSGAPPVRFECWDGSSIGPPDAPAALRLRNPRALRHMLWHPDELGLGRAYVAGDLDLDGDIVDGLGALEISPPRGVRKAMILREAWRVAQALHLVGPPPAPPPEEAHVHGLRHSMVRDAQAISHHYDVGNEFYAVVLGPSMTYSCARWGPQTSDLAAAQAAKHDLVCRKLGLAIRPGQRLLDVGCGWGSMAIHAARNYDARVVGITISAEQHAAALARVRDADVAERAGFEVRDVESLREHYARTLRAWITNLERDWDGAVAAAGEGRARVWRAYMAGSALGFDAGRISIHQTLAVVPNADGASGMPWRRDW